MFRPTTVPAPSLDFIYKTELEFQPQGIYPKWQGMRTGEQFETFGPPRNLK